MLIERTDFLENVRKIFWKNYSRDKKVEKIDWDIKSRGQGIKTRVHQLERQNLSRPSTPDSRQSEILMSKLHSAG